MKYLEDDGKNNDDNNGKPPSDGRPDDNVNDAGDVRADGNPLIKKSKNK